MNLKEQFGASSNAIHDTNKSEVVFVPTILEFLCDSVILFCRLVFEVSSNASSDTHKLFFLQQN